MTIGIQAGYCTPSSIKVLVVSDNSASVAVVCDGVTKLVTMIPTGTDKPSGGYIDDGAAFVVPSATIACYTGECEFTGLVPLTRYLISTSGHDITAMTAPEVDDDFTFFIGTCISTPGQTQPATDDSDWSGMFTEIRSIIEDPNTLPVVGMICIDDNLYIDRIVCDSSTSKFWNTANGVGPVNHTSAISGCNVYNYDSIWNCVIGYMSIFDDFLPDGPGGNGVKGTDRGWCYKNMNWFGQIGDHEFWNDIGLSAVDGSAADFPTEYNNCLSAWNSFYGRIQPPKINASNGNAWSLDLGCVQIIAPDRIKNADQVEDANGPLLGSSQISDLKSKIDGNPLPFKIVALGSGIRSLDSVNVPVVYGPQESMWDMGTGSLGEYQSLFTDAGGIIDMSNNGISANPDGFTFFTAHGDWHNGLVVKNTNSSGTFAENFMSFYAGTLTGSVNVLFDNSWTVGHTKDGSEIVWRDSRTPLKNKWCIQVDVFGSHTPRQMRVSMLSDESDGDKYSVWYEEGQDGNFGVVPRNSLEMIA